MLSKVLSFALSGLEGLPVEIETDISNGVVSYDIVGLPDAAIKESKERIRSAIKNSRLLFPINKVTINLAPADIRKEGTQYDLPIAISMLVASEGISANTDGIVFLGELALDGSLRHVNGILPIIISALKRGYTRFVVPKANENEVSYIEGTQCFALNNLCEVVLMITGERIFTPVEHRSFKAAQLSSLYQNDMKYIKGQRVAKRAAEIAVAGGHNLLLVGPPGAGKTMIARCLPTIMPDLTFDEALEITKIMSISGELSEEGICSLRPFRTPHHTATTVSLTGGGNVKIKAGEISKAHYGVLFLDELPEYSRSVLESLRQPLEDKVITISRATGAITFPADFVLCASMNPCPCGNLGSSDRECTCTPSMINKYRSKISGPLLDRIDLQVEVDGVKYEQLASTNFEEDSASIKSRVEMARQIQRARFDGENVGVNANMKERHIAKYCVLDSKCEQILRRAYDAFHLSARARTRIIKVARTIADLSMSTDIKPQHIMEAASYRSFESERK